MLAKKCLQCGITFYFKNYRKDTAKFCSVKCGSKYRWNHSKKLQESFKHNFSGKNHPQWNGGRSTNSQGYILVYSPNHPHKDDRNCVREHRLVMEKHLNRYLSTEEVVHHINGNRQDNRIENLQLFSKVEHDTFHAKVASELAKSRRIKKICPNCHKEFSVPRSLERIVCCSISCKTYYKWKTQGLKGFGRHER